MAELFQTSRQSIAKHLKAIFAEGELSRDSVVNSWLTTVADGNRRIHIGSIRTLDFASSTTTRAPAARSDSYSFNAAKFSFR